MVGRATADSSGPCALCHPPPECIDLSLVEVENLSKREVLDHFAKRR